MNVPLNQANIAPKGVSPRHTLALDNFDVIKHDIAQVGHVIVDNCFPVDSVQELSNVCLDFFSQYDQAFKEGKRESTIMQRIVKGLSGNEIKSISEYIAKNAR